MWFNTRGIDFDDTFKSEQVVNDSWMVYQYLPTEFTPSDFGSTTRQMYHGTNWYALRSIVLSKKTIRF